MYNHLNQNISYLDLSSPYSSAAKCKLSCIMSVFLFVEQGCPTDSVVELSDTVHNLDPHNCDYFTNKSHLRSLYNVTLKTRIPSTRVFDRHAYCIMAF